MKRTVVSVVLFCTLAFGTTGCLDNLGKDQIIRAPYQSVPTPDNYSAVITWCDHGNRLYMVYNDDKLFVVPNAVTCEGQ